MHAASSSHATETVGREDAAHRLAHALAWFSLGLGAAELAAPRALGDAIGLEGKDKLLQGYGAREIAAGIGILSGQAELGMWSRVAGDALDLATLAVGLRGSSSEQKRNAGIAIAAVAGVTVLDIAVASALTRQRGRPSNGRSRTQAANTTQLDRVAAPDLPTVQMAAA